MDLNDTGELDIFITNAKYSSYLHRVTCGERRLTRFQDSYRGFQVVQTLEQHLMAPDSPALKGKASSTSHVYA